MSRTADIPRTIWMHVFTPLTVLTLYIVSFSFFYSWFLPGNVNAVFVAYAWQFALTAAAISYLVLFVVFKRTRGSRLTLGDSGEKIGAADFVLILLPLTPVVGYILNNQDILSPLGSLYVLIVFVAFSALFVLAIPTLFGIVGSIKALMLMGMAFAFMLTNMASLSAHYAWFGVGSLRIQLAILGAILVGASLLYRNRVGRKFLYLFVVVFFITGIVFQFAPEGWAQTAPADSDRDNRLLDLAASRSPLFTPNIYLLVYESYVASETMLAYGIDNRAQEKYLEDLGFNLYPHTYSVGGATIGTMSRVLNASTQYYGNPRRGVSGDGVVQNLLRTFGYETHGIFSSDYMFRGIGSSYDYSLPEAGAPPSGHQSLVKAILMGEFRFDIDFDRISPEQFLERKTITFENLPDSPIFVYMHDPFPGHSQNSGACLPNETELFREGLIQANRRMKQDVETIMQNDPAAIIIVAGDHGPYLTKNCTSTGRQYSISEISRLDTQDRFGTFLAIRWPVGSFSQYDDITVLQDLFPAIFAYLFEDDGLLMAKVEPNTLEHSRISGAQVKNGIIYGGINDGEPLFLSGG